MACSRMKSTSPVILPESANCIVPYFSPRDYVRHVSGFDEIIDVRSPAEYEEDHIPGAINLPVLDNNQRAEVGTLHNSKENGVSLKPRARQLGAAYISANTSKHLLQHFLGKELTYKPLIYCWRGGQRSRSMAIILKEIGFCPWILQGGWRDYRKLVRNGVTLVEDPERLDSLDQCKIILVSGSTGSGKSLLLETLEKAGEQVIHLERLAKHKGSTLGNYPGEPQPSQKMFESLLWHQIQFQLDPSQVIWVENESAKVGKVAVPNRLWKKMCQSPRIHMVVQLEDRVKFTMSDYSYFCDKENAANSAGSLEDLLGRLEKHAGKQKSKDWIQLAKEGDFEKLTKELIVGYYDLNYKKPRGDPLATYEVPPGLILDPEKLLQSSLLKEIIEFGKNYIEALKDGDDENFDSEIEN